MPSARVKTLTRSWLALCAAVFCLSPSLAGAGALDSNAGTPQCPVTAVGAESSCGGIRFQWTATNEQFWSYSISGNTEAFVVTQGTCFNGQVNPVNTRCMMATVTFKPTVTSPKSIMLTAQSSTGFASITLTGTGTYGYTWHTGVWSPQVGCASNVEQSRSVQCYRSDNTVADESLCTSSKPEATRTWSDFSSCAYSWQTGEYGQCAGGSGGWQVGDWAPALGCGNTAQARSVTCAVDVNSGARTRTVTCLRSDGVESASQLCDAPAPASSEPCTPAETVCGAAPADAQTVILNDCTDEGSGDEGDGGSESPPSPVPVKKALCSPDAANHKYCVWMPL